MKQKTQSNDEQRKIEGMYQRAMDLRDSTPKPPTEKQEGRYRRAYLHAFNRSHDVNFFRKMTLDYRRVCRKDEVSYE